MELSDKAFLIESIEDPSKVEILNNVTRHRKLCLDLNALYLAKNTDYGDAFHTLFLQEGIATSRIRLGDKYYRFCSLTRGENEQQVTDESVRDTLIDLANYALMSVMELDRLDKKEKESESLPSENFRGNFS